MVLAGVSHQPEGPAGTQFHVRELHLAVVDAAYQQSFGAPVKLEGLTQRKARRHEGVGCFASRTTPLSNEIGGPTVAAAVALFFDLAVSLPAPVLRRYSGSSPSLASRTPLRIVFRDSPVPLAISRSEFLSRLYIRLTFPNICFGVIFVGSCPKSRRR